MIFDDEEDCDQEDIIPGDNDKQVPPFDPPLGATDAPSNLTHILPIDGEIPIELEITK